jgi:hypothetical protein
LMSDSLVQRITYRLKHVAGVDRRLLMEAREALSGLEGVPVAREASEPVSGFVIPMEAGENRSEAFVRVTGVKLMPWQRKWLNRAEL